MEFLATDEVVEFVALLGYKLTSHDIDFWVKNRKLSGHTKSVLDGKYPASVLK